MNRIFLLYKTEILSACAIALLSVWALSSTVIAISRNDKVVIFRINSDGESELIGEKNDGALAEPFIYRYVQLMYNYDSNSFESNVRKSLPYLSQEFWTKIKPDFIASIAKIKERRVVQSTAITTKVSKIDGNQYAFATQSEITKNSSDGNRTTETQMLKVLIQVKKVQRSLENPFGWEVQNVSEERI